MSARVNPRRAASQLRWPSRSTIRTVFQAIVGFAPLAPAIYTSATQHDPAQATGLAAVALLWLGGFTRIMALPGVEQWLQKYVPWLSAEPKVAAAASLRRAYGRRPPKRARAIAFADLPTRLLLQLQQAIPDTFDSIRGWTGWKMLGNDAAGDCVAVTWATILRIVSLSFAGVEDYPSQERVWAIYKTQNPGFDPNGTAQTNGPGSAHDRGMDIQTLLEHLVAIGAVLAFAEVDRSDLDQMKLALATFGFLWLGVNVTDANEKAFPGPWSYRHGDKVLGGHSITGTGYDAAGNVLMETWADEGSLTALFLAKLLEEAWVVIFPAHAAHLDQVARNEFDSVFHATTGKHVDFSSVPLPTPAPTPQPDPVAGTADALDQVLWGLVSGWVAKSHNGVTRPVAAALRSWAKGKGLA